MQPLFRIALLYLILFSSCQDDEIINSPSNDCEELKFSLSFDYPFWSDNIYVQISDTLGNIHFEESTFTVDSIIVLPLLCEGFYNLTYSSFLSYPNPSLTTIVNCPNNLSISYQSTIPRVECIPHGPEPIIGIIEIENAINTPYSYNIGGNPFSHPEYTYQNSSAFFEVPFLFESNFEITYSDNNVFSYIVERDSFEHIAPDTMFQKINFENFERPTLHKVLISKSDNWTYALNICNASETVIMTSKDISAETDFTNTLLIPLSDNYLNYNKHLILRSGVGEGYFYSDEIPAKFPNLIQIDNPKVVFDTANKEGFAFRYNQQTNYNFNVTEFKFEESKKWFVKMKLADNYHFKFPKISSSVFQYTDTEAESIINHCLESHIVKDNWPNYHELDANRGEPTWLRNFRLSKVDRIR